MGLPQREGRPDLSIAPADTPSTASWDEHYDNTGANPLNHPVDERKGKPAVNGWQTIASDIVSEGEGFSKGDGGEKR